MTNVNAPAVATLTSSTMLVELNISQWAGRKKDKRASRDVTIANNAKSGAANVTKKLLGDCPELVAIHKLTGNVRNHTHYHFTMPWLDCGLRLLTTAAYFEYNEIMTGIQNEFYRLVDVFINNYSWEITQAQVDLGDMFNRNDYPTEDDLRAKFAFRINYMPTPASGDFRLDVANDANDDLNTHYNNFYENKVAEAMNDVWTRLHDKMSALSERLDYGDNERKKIFKESTINGLIDVVDLLDMLNVTNDPEMSKMKVHLEDTMRGITPEALREDAGLRAETKKQMDAAIAALPTLM